MKKYVKPIMILDEFALDMSIAGNCTYQDELMNEVFENLEPGIFNSDEEFQAYLKEMGFWGDMTDDLCYFTHTSKVFSS